MNLQSHIVKMIVKNLMLVLNSRSLTPTSLYSEAGRSEVTRQGHQVLEQNGPRAQMLSPLSPIQMSSKIQVRYPFTCPLIDTVSNSS